MIMQHPQVSAVIDHNAWWVSLAIAVSNVLPPVLASLASAAAFVWYCIKIVKEMKGKDTD